MIQLYENYLQTKEHGPYHNTHISQSQKYRPFGRFVGRHKTLGASSCCHLKQFDVHRGKAYNLFKIKSATRVYGRNYTIWGFGKISKKFLYKKSQTE